jgi:UMF1 family MFS transporter
VGLRGGRLPPLNDDALFSRDALNPGVRRREVFGWAMYDFANSGYTTVVITAVFAAYFVGGIARRRNGPPSPGRWRSASPTPS